jgi:hypothetical protein
MMGSQVPEMMDPEMTGPEIVKSEKTSAIVERLPPPLVPVVLVGVRVVWAQLGELEQLEEQMSIPKSPAAASLEEQTPDSPAE